MFTTIHILLLLALLAFLAIVYFVFSSIKLRLKFDESNKFIDLSYTFIRFRILFNDKTGRLYLLWIPVKRFDLLDIIAAKEPKEIDKEEIPKKKKRKPFRLGSINLNQILFYLKRMSYLIRKIKIKYLNINISDGFSDPYYTGQLYAIYSTLTGMFPKLMSHVNFTPDFSADNIKIDGEGLVKLRICHILLPILQILADKILGMVRTPLLRFKKGTSYV